MLVCEKGLRKEGYWQKDVDLLFKSIAHHC